MNGYGALLVDCPWEYKNWSPKGEGRNANQHYPTMSDDELLRFRDETLLDGLLAKDCVIFMWAIDPKLDFAMELLKAWGFTYKTVGFYWVKETKLQNGWHMGPGYWTRANPETCLLGTRGHPKRLSASVRKLIIEPVREHSRKPEAFYERVPQLVGGPYLELFGRQRREGFDVWGNEVDKFAEVS